MHINKLCSDSRWTSWKGNCTRSTNEDIRHLIKKLSNLANYTISSLIYSIQFPMITSFFKFSIFPFNRDSFDHSPSVRKILSKMKNFFHKFFSWLPIIFISNSHFLRHPLRTFLEQLGLRVKWTTHKSRSRKLFCWNLEAGRTLLDLNQKDPLLLRDAEQLMSSICRFDDSRMNWLNLDWID